MNAFQRILLKAAGAAGWIPESLVFGVGQAQWSQWNFQAYCKEAFEGNPFVYRAVTQIQQAAMGVKVWPYRPKGEGMADLPAAHPAAVLLRRPAPLYPWPAWVEAMVGYRMLGGNAFALTVGPDKPDVATPRPPRQMHPLGPDVMAPLAGPSLGALAGFNYRAKGGDVKLPEPWVFWWSTWNPLDQYQGMPPIKAADKAIDANNGALSYNKAIMDNGGFVGNVFSSDSPSFGAEQAKQVRDSMGAKYDGASRAGKNLILWGGLKPFRMGLTPVEMGFSELTTATARQVALVFGVPPELLGDGSQKTFSNYREARQALYTETVLPLLDDLCARLGQFLSLRFGEEISIEPDSDDVEALSGMREMEQLSARENFKAGLTTRDEAREMIGQAAIGGPEGEAFSAAPQPLQLQGLGGKAWTVYTGKKARA
jgi:HK97 family phage portal protein